jgi:hypothetical protein
VLQQLADEVSRSRTWQAVEISADPFFAPSPVLISSAISAPHPPPMWPVWLSSHTSVTSAVSVSAPLPPPPMLPTSVAAPTPSSLAGPPPPPPRRMPMPVPGPPPGSAVPTIAPSSASSAVTLEPQREKARRSTTAADVRKKGKVTSTAVAEEVRGSGRLTRPLDPGGLMCEGLGA